MIQMPHVMGGYGMTPNAIAQISAKVAMDSHFLGIVGSSGLATDTTHPITADYEGI